MRSLCTLYEEFVSLPQTPQDEEPQVILQMFERLLEILHAPDVLPLSQELASLMTLFSKLMQRHAITLALGEEGEVSSVAFAVWGSRADKETGVGGLWPTIMFPKNYLAQVRENLFKQLGFVIHLASQVRDFASYRLDPEVSPIRGHAYEATFLLEMQVLHEQEGLSWGLTSAQQLVLETFPEGIKSAPDLIYPTPPLLFLSHREE